LRQQALAIAVAFVCALATWNASADERSERLGLELAALYAGAPARPLDEIKLEALRARLAAPTPPERVGVVLWDEPRKGTSPPRTASPDAPSANLSVGISIHR
jgi:hypothetical protein